jgi:glycosyltransferase involved in cell wall biosynthesis
MTRLLVINHFPLLPARNGGQQAVLGLALQLARQWPTEVVWTERKTSATAQVQLQGRTLTTTAVPNLWLQRKAARFLRRWLGVVENDMASMLFSAANLRLQRHLFAHSQDGDVFVLAHPWLWPAVHAVLQRRRAWLVYDAHNIEHVLKQQSLPDSWVARHLVQRLRTMERDIVRRAQLTLACTQRDADALCSLADIDASRVWVGSKGIDRSPEADAAALARQTRSPGHRAVFVGSSHPPNNAAARWIIERLAPACPAWQFEIVGACGPAAGVAPRSANLLLRGAVDSLAQVLADADVALNPVSEGSGINMKLFDYLRHGLPVLSTPLGARGFEQLPASGLQVCEREGFAPTLAAWREQPRLLTQLAAQGPACVREHFDWDVVGQRVRTRMATMMAGALR